MTIKRIIKIIKKNATNAHYRLTYKRKSRLYCIGTAKSGTHSIDSMFDNTIRTQHEAESTLTINKIIEILEGKLNDKEISSFITRRDRRLCLDVDSSQLNFFLKNYLLNEFSDARFLLTIRDCYSWLDSFINDSLRRSVGNEWIRLRELRFRTETFSHPKEEAFLKERGLYTLDGYLSYWAYHNNKVITEVPENKLLIVKTNEITKRAYDIAKFAGISPESVRTDKSHAFKNESKFNVLKDIDESYLESKVDQHCSTLMKQFFPDIHSIRDARI